MSTHIQGRVIHSSVLEILSFEEIKAMIDVRDMLISSNIKIEFDMERVSDCGTPLCMAGHIAFRLGLKTYDDQSHWFVKRTRPKVNDNRRMRELKGQLDDLFSGGNPSNRTEAAEAIDHYLATGSGRWPFYQKSKDVQREVWTRAFGCKFEETDRDPALHSL